MGQKNTFFEKRTGEVAENKQKLAKNKPEQTGKQSGEVVEKTCLWKRQTGTNRKTKLAMSLKIQDSQKCSPCDRQRLAKASRPAAARTFNGIMIDDLFITDCQSSKCAPAKGPVAGQQNLPVRCLMVER
ncbi:MAG TPA: hypothetical protein VFQ24_11520 [Terriglobia bacterium]|nr:hypothetical protein [Terriglobia bacterium]